MKENALNFLPSYSTYLPRSNQQRLQERPSCVLNQDNRFSAPLVRTLHHPRSVEPPPLHRSIPLFGPLLEKWIDVPPAHSAAKYNGIYTSCNLCELIHVITDKGAITEIEKETKSFTTKGSHDVFTEIFGKNSMIFSDGDDHKRLRQKVEEAFSSKFLPFFFEKILNQVRKTWRGAQLQVKTAGPQELNPALRRLSLSIIVELTTGLHITSERSSEIVAQFSQISKALYGPAFSPVCTGGKDAMKEIISTLTDLIERSAANDEELIEAIRVGESSNCCPILDNQNHSLLQKLIAKSGISDRTGTKRDEEVNSIAHMMSLLWFSGYATTAAALLCSVFEMGFNSEVWHRLSAEQDALMIDAGAVDATLHQVVLEMPLLDSYITEVLRLHPPIKGVSRVATRDVSILGKMVRAGEKVFLDFRASNRDAHRYSDPNILMMDRFHTSSGHYFLSETMSFGARESPHYCSGAFLGKIVLKTTLATLLREYVIKLDPNQSQAYYAYPDETPVSNVVLQHMNKRT